ncbi:MAG TPA: anthrone oxygenase family protein [Aldersonia sp.]
MTVMTVKVAFALAAAVTTGLLAGLFYAYCYSVMRALAGADDRTFVDVMQRINVAIVNPWFLVCFLGSLGFTAAAAVAHLRGDRTMLAWVAAALVLNLAGFAVTVAGNVPLNNRLAAVDLDHTADLVAVRAQFETAWVRWNVVRTVLHTAAFVALGWVLVLEQGTSQAASS